MSGPAKLLEMRFDSRPEGLRRVRGAVSRTLAEVGCGERDRQLLVLAVNEACMNVIQHAYKGDPAGEMILEILNNDGELEFRLTDFAAPVDPAAIRPRALDRVRPGGLGTHFIREIMDEFTYQLPDIGNGNLLIMKKKYRPDQEASRDAM